MSDLVEAIGSGPLPEIVPEAIHIHSVKLRVMARTCENSPIPIVRKEARKTPPAWRLTGERCSFQGELYEKVEILSRGNTGSGTGKYIRLSDLDGRRVSITLREVTL